MSWWLLLLVGWPAINELHELKCRSRRDSGLTVETWHVVSAFNQRPRLNAQPLHFIGMDVSVHGFALCPSHGLANGQRILQNHVNRWQRRKSARADRFDRPAIIED